jgi:hypothetical protein
VNVETEHLLAIVAMREVGGCGVGELLHLEALMLRWRREPIGELRSY